MPELTREALGTMSREKSNFLSMHKAEKDLKNLTRQAEALEGRSPAAIGRGSN